MSGPASLFGKRSSNPGYLARFPEIDLAVNKVGIFGRQIKLDQLLEDGDQVEIYRPLISRTRRKRASDTPRKIDSAINDAEQVG
ncbi:RnfH family protein [uncultured Thiocystis sp.]|jgi:putative ubiquitin-RnfH superfamily antitoxin RatB of RatAB toxin-antitoxin module|uniref:RnfH family protein n=1 Tax=uncultured Thiocystis sp. TaxID=1202134 RepID=UPI00342B37CE